GALGPLREELAATGWRQYQSGSADRRRKMPQQGAARRAGRRSGRSSLSVLGDGSARETDHQMRRSAPAPVGALLPSIFGERKRTKAQPARQDKRAAEPWLSDN